MNFNQQVTVALGNPDREYSAFFEAVSISYSIELEQDEIDTILEGEARLTELSGGDFHGTLAHKLERAQVGVQKTAYGNALGRFISLRLSGQFTNEVNFVKITTILSNHIDICKAALILTEHPSACDCHG